MATSLAFDDNEHLPTPRSLPITRTRHTVDFRPRLTAILQTTLDIDELFRLFFKEVGDIVENSSCRYTLEAETLNIRLGQEAPHNCCYRLLTNDDYLGEITFTRSQPFAKYELKLLEDATSTLIYPIRNALRYRQAIKSALTDSLTEVGNRIAFENSMQRELDLANRYDAPLSLLMIDLDHFKLVNDNYGHSAGDAVLKAVADEITLVTRCADMTFRYGGEEFLVLLNKTSAAGARIIAERLRAAIAGLACVHDRVEIPVTISLGCATWRCLENKEQFLKRADDALYQAKAQGRNRVIASEVLELKRQTQH